MGQNKKGHGGMRDLVETGFTEDVAFELSLEGLTKSRRRHLGLRGFSSMLPAVMTSLRLAVGVGRGETEARVWLTCPVDNESHLGV